MSKLRVNCFTLSLDGYGAGPEQSLQNPLGKGGFGLHQWLLPTRSFKSLHLDRADMPAGVDGTTGIDDDFARAGAENVGAWILGRNMFGPVRGPWPDESWRGWWGENPPYHVPVFVLTHHARAPLEMPGGTTFYFVTGGIESALEQARSAAGTRDIRLGGGVSTIRQYLKARLIDELQLSCSPVLLGSGEHLLHGIDLPALGYRVTRHAASEAATHLVIERS